jgi:hypothetical protein
MRRFKRFRQRVYAFTRQMSTQTFVTKVMFFAGLNVDRSPERKHTYSPRQALRKTY